MKNKDIYWRRCNIQETVHRTMMPLSPSKQTPWHLTQFFQSPSAALPYFPESHRWSEISFLLKVILILGKGRSFRVPNLGCSGAKSSEWCDVSPKDSARDVIYEHVHCHDEAANHQLPTAVAFWIIWIVSTEECSSLRQLWCRFIALITQSFWMHGLHSTHAHSTVSAAPTD